MPTFTPPTQQWPLGGAPFWYRFTYSASPEAVVLLEGHYASLAYPDNDFLLQGKEGVDWFLGGREYEVDNDTALALQQAGYTVVGDVVDPTPVPFAPAIVFYEMPTRTTATIGLSHSGTGEAVDNFNIYRDGVKVATLTAAQLTFFDSGLPVATPEIQFSYYATAENEAGESEHSNTVALQWQTVVEPPDPPDPPVDPDGYGLGGYGEGLYGDQTPTPTEQENTYGAGPYGDGPYGDQ